jgi:hypothetical protein
VTVWRYWGLFAGGVGGVEACGLRQAGVRLGWAPWMPMLGAAGQSRAGQGRAASRRCAEAAGRRVSGLCGPRWREGGGGLQRGQRLSGLSEVDAASEWAVADGRGDVGGGSADDGRVASGKGSGSPGAART